jgi:ABC-type transporter Mla subunit MlaD
MGEPLNTSLTAGTAPATDPAPVPASVNQALLGLCAAVLPVWGRQLATSRVQSEAAVTEMLSAFAEIGPHLDRAARQSGQITAALAQGDGGITQLGQACANELQPVLAGLDAPAAQAVGRVMTMIQQSVDALEQIAKPFAHETLMVSQQVERMYKGFQYQDRISQMMGLLFDDIQRLQAVLEQPGADPAALAQADWLARLESLYAMTEQRDSHGDPAGGLTAATDGDTDTLFF